MSIEATTSWSETSPSAALTPSATSPAPTGAFVKLLKGLGSEVDRGERLVTGAIAARGAELGSGDLIALQAGIYRYTEVVDLAAKLVDRAATGVRTTLQTNG